ncbi:MAG: D-tyrosyl-tRNA(Tyr) deacylase [Crocinitomicaceae bacterium]|jgi:D-tyrosyl-tRNA(Tyr) deacylase|nr:D-tyrosyl-tRNA(Tyr) deacylase [Crocinitomicaceae bacterium]
MRLVVQRVTEASVRIDGELHNAIGLGLLLLLGVEDEDQQEDADWLVQKVANMRIFGDEEGKMNLSVMDKSGEILVISQFTLHASTKKGNRPGFTKSARPEQAIPLYEYFVEKLKNESALTVKTGIFGADMKVALLNDGPVTILMDSKNKE